jgi:hypothetical protein
MAILTQNYYCLMQKIGFKENQHFFEENWSKV